MLRRELRQDCPRRRPCEAEDADRAPGGKGEENNREDRQIACQPFAAGPRFELLRTPYNRTTFHSPV